MPRQARLDAPGTVHHVMVRGIEKRKMVDDERDQQAFVGRMGGWSAVQSRREKGERVISDERVFGDGEFVARVLGEAEERVKHQLPSERRVHEAMKLVEAVCKDRDVSSEELGSGSRRGPVAQARSLLAGRLVRELRIPQAEAARLLGVTTPAIAKAL